MSIAGFGRIMPIHGAILQLIGWRLGRGKSDIPISERKRITEMREGRRDLVDQTGQDFGYDLARWREYLMKSKHGYRHPYAFGIVDRTVRTTIRDLEFQCLAIQAATGEPENIVEEVKAERAEWEAREAVAIEARRAALARWIESIESVDWTKGDARQAEEYMKRLRDEIEKQ